MKKILISPLGTGQLDKENQSQRAYRKAKYRIDDKEYETSFIADALKQHFNLDGIVFIGTVKSMWEEVYKTFVSSCDENYWLELSETVENANHETPIETINLQKLEEALGANYKCILIKYGLDEKELQYNLEHTLKEIQKYFSKTNEKIEIHLDITHSFRSLALYIFLIMMLIKNLSFGKEMKIKGIYYGMLDIIRELGYAKIVDLGYLNKALDFIQASHDFDKYGNGFLLAKLLRKQEQEQIAGKIENFSKAMSMNYSSNVIESMQEIQNIKIKEPYSFFRPTKILQTIEKIRNQEKLYLKELELATWHHKNKNYSNAYILLAESIVTYQCMQEHKNPQNPQERDAAKESLRNQNSELSTIYNTISKIRNRIAHNIPNGNLQKDFNSLGNYINQVKQLIN